MNQKMASTAAMMVPSAAVNEIVKRLSELTLKEVKLLSGVKDELKKLKRKLETISDVLEDAENREFQDATVRSWLIELRDIMYDIEDIINDCFLHNINNSSHSCEHGSTSTGPPPVSDQPSAPKKARVTISGMYEDHVMGKRIEEINGRMEQIHKNREQLKLVQIVQIQGSVPSQAPAACKSRETTSWFSESKVVGIDEDAQSLVLSMEEPSTTAGGRVFAIVGMGGIGKTTLAQKVYKKSDFDKKIWVCVSQDYKENDVLKQIIRSAGGVCRVDQTKEELYSEMVKLIHGKHVLVVLDDLWSDGVWENCLRVPFEALTAKSRVLITTRDEGIARKIGAARTHQVKLLSDDDALSLLCKVVCIDKIEGGLKNVSMDIVRKCKGLPLAIKVIGGVLKRRRINEREWRTVLSEVLRLSEDGTSEITSVLQLSYMDLPSYLKPCFLFCSLFPEDYHIRQTQVIQMWVAEGLVKEQEGDAHQMEDVAELYYDELVLRSLLQVVSQHPDPMYNTCKMHDLVRDLAILMTRDEHIIGHDRKQGSSMKARRLSILKVEEQEQIPERVKNQKYCSLRSLLVFQSRNMKVIPPSLSNKLKRLRVLDLSDAWFQHLPDSIGELVHLRYLNLSEIGIAVLPDSICKLRHLQTLLLRKSDISEIPKGCSQLQKLRHLELPRFVNIHANIGKLTGLQTLQDFSICERDDGRCSIEELNCLSQLRYLKVSIYMVPSPTEAREAPIENKTHLRSLELRGSYTYNEKEEERIRRMEKILEEFRPNESLECLVMALFDAQDLPGWISMTTPLLRNLNYLKLKRIVNLEQLPSLGHLPQLRILKVDRCEPMKTLGLEPDFNRGGNGGGAYPRLEQLYLWYMIELEEKWGDDGESRDESDDIFPRLKLLNLKYCPKLESLPKGLLGPNKKLRAGIELECVDVAFDKNIYL